MTATLNGLPAAESRIALAQDEIPPDAHEVARESAARTWARLIRQVLIDESVGLEEIDDGIWNVSFGPFWLGRFDEHERYIHGRITAAV